MAFLGNIPADWSPEQAFIVADADIERAAAGDAAHEAELRSGIDADPNAGESLRRPRRTIHTAQQRATGDALGDMLTHISWRELIHTSYFEVEEVAAIVTDAIASSRVG